MNSPIPPHKYFCAIDNCGALVSKKHRSDHEFVHHDILYPGRQGRRISDANRIIITPNSKRRFKDEKKKIDEECRAKRKLLIDRYQPPTAVIDYQNATDSDYQPPTAVIDYQNATDSDYQPSTAVIDYQKATDSDQFPPGNQVNNFIFIMQLKAKCKVINRKF